MRTRLAVAAILLAACLPAARAGATPPTATSYRTFDLAIYCRVDDVYRMAQGDWLEKNWDVLTRHLRIGKVYLETHRSRVVNDRDAMLKVKAFFESRGIRTAGGITLVADEGREFKQFSYTDPADRKHVEDVVRFTAGLFDELILDDFFFTTTKSESDVRAKGTRSWTDFRLALMTEAAQSLVIGPARAVNPRIKVVIKYPNWYEHFPHAGFNLEAEPRMFDGIYTGTETRDPVLSHQHLQEYQSYSIMRYFENVKPGGNGGGWVDPFARITLDRYAEQLELTLLSKAREITLFCFSDILAPVREADGTRTAASRLAPVAGDTLARADALLGQLGTPVGVSAYKPYHSSGEDFLHAFIGMLGIPMEMTPVFDEKAPVVFLNQAAAHDPAIVSRMEKHLASGRSVVVTSGLVRALAGKGFERIADLEVTDRKVLTRRFTNLRGGGVWDADKEILLPQLRYPTNDSWEELSALDGQNGYPLLHHADYGNGRLYVLVVPDNPADLYALPQPALDHIRRALTPALPVRLQAPSRVGLFTYDNGAFVVHSFLDRGAVVEAVVAGTDATLVDLQTGLEVRGQARSGETVFPVYVEPRQSKAFRRVAPGTSRAAAINRLLGRGVNVVGYDPIWQDRAKARFKAEHFGRIREAGFTSVRINLHPFKHMDAARGWALEPSWLETLDWAVEGALAADLAVVLDMHEFHAMAADPAGKRDAWLAFWRQVAPRFKDAPDRVVFELLNEPFDKLTPELWNQYLREGLAVVRASNPSRVVIIGPGRWNAYDALPTLDLPKDDRNIIVTVHYYRPMPFTHQGAPWAAQEKDKSGIPWLGVDQERRRIDIDFGRVHEWADANGRPIYLGEFGAYEKADMDSRARYTATVARTAERLGWSWAYWQFDSDFVVFDVAKGAWVEPIRKALLP